MMWPCVCDMRGLLSMNCTASIKTGIMIASVCRVWEAALSSYTHHTHRASSTPGTSWSTLAVMSALQVFGSVDTQQILTLSSSAL